jgi:hypothetical protein
MAVVAQPVNVNVTTDSRTSVGPNAPTYGAIPIDATKFSGNCEWYLFSNIRRTGGNDFSVFAYLTDTNGNVEVTGRGR